MQKQTAISDAPLMVPLRQVAKRIGISHKTIAKYPHDFFEVLQLGSHRYVRRADLTAWVDRMSDTASGRVQPNDDDGRAARA